MTPEDIWQDTLYMAWRDRDQHTWEGPRPYYRWLLAIAKNRIRDAADILEARKRGGDQRIDVLSTLVSEHGFSEFLPPGSTTPSQIAMHGERAQAMEAALGSLPVELRDAVRLYLFEDLPMSVVAERLGVSLMTARRRFYRGAALYRNELERALDTRIDIDARKRRRREPDDRA